MQVALTYDDGPGPSTAALLDVLEAQRAVATFFLLGRNVTSAPWTEPPGDEPFARSLVLRMVRSGHLIGNHTWTHRFPISATEFCREIEATDGLLDALYRECGRVPPLIHPVRLPYGLRGEHDNNFASRLAALSGMRRTHVHWSSDFEDWTLGQGDGQKLAEQMIAHAAALEAEGRDAVLDLHDAGTGSSFGYARPATVEATEIFLTEAKARGWSIVIAPAGVLVAA